VVAEVDRCDVRPLTGEGDRVRASLPRAAPVISATLPCTRPDILTSLYLALILN
jgi:hypothetical protein